jgi:hypothetical protein
MKWAEASQSASGWHEITAIARVRCVNEPRLVRLGKAWRRYSLQNSRFAPSACLARFTARAGGDCNLLANVPHGG